MLNDVRVEAVPDADSIFNHLEGNSEKQLNDEIRLKISPSWNTNVSDKCKELIKLMVEP